MSRTGRRPGDITQDAVSSRAPLSRRRVALRSRVSLASRIRSAESQLSRPARERFSRIRAALNEGEGAAGTGFVFGPYGDAWTALLGWADPAVSLAAFIPFSIVDRSFTPSG